MLMNAVQEQADSPSRDASQDKVRQRTRRAIAVVEEVFIAFSLYVLSIGPLYWKWYSAKYVEGAALLAAFYEPLWFLAGWIPGFGEWLNWYVRLWIFGF